MKHPYRIREIADQAGLSQATVDRVLHNRGGVRASTAREVHQAIATLDRQQSPAGPAFQLDVVVSAPARFTAAVRQALEDAVLGVRIRFHPVDDPAGLPAVLERVARSRSHGLILQAPDRPAVVEAVGRLDLPVVTLVTDLPASKRVAHAGIDHADAGATAAYLLEQWLADRAGDVLVVRGPAGDPGADDRAAGFRAEMSSRGPNRRLLEIAGAAVRTVLAANPSVRAVYSVSAGLGVNAAVVDAFAAEHRNYDVFVAHDLDGGNAELLRDHRLSAVLHHDLRADLRYACWTLIQAQGAPGGPIPSHRAAVQVVTPFNFFS